MIGAGASGFQVAPTIADKVAHLTVFQRTAQWMFPNPTTTTAVGPGVQWALKHLPFYGRWYRFLLFWPWCDTGLVAAKVDPDWPDQQRSVSAVNDIARMMFTEWITSQIDGDTELLAKVIPDYPRHRQAHTAGQRQLAAHPDPRQRRTGPHRHRADRGRRGGGHRRRPPPRRCVDLCDRIPGQRHVVLDWISTAATESNSGLLGQTTGGLPRHHGAGLPQFLLPLRSGHQPGQRRQPDLPLRVRGALHHGLPRSADRRQAGKRTMEPHQDRYDDWYARSQAELTDAGLVPTDASSTATTRTPTVWCIR